MDTCVICGTTGDTRERFNAMAGTWEAVCQWQSGCMAPDSVRRVTGINYRQQ